MVECIVRESFDVIVLVLGVWMGYCYFLIIIIEEIVDLFLGFGYSVVEGFEVEWDYYNFMVLNIFEDYLVWDMQDIFYLGGDLLMWIYIFLVQICYFEENLFLVWIVVFGWVYCCDVVDVIYLLVFYQVEVLVIDEGFDFSYLCGMVMVFFKVFFGDLLVCFWVSYFFFIEFFVEVDVQWCGCWFEVMGCGMVDFVVLEGLGFDFECYSGFVVGFGVECFCMVCYGIDDICCLYISDLCFFEQF